MTESRISCGTQQLFKSPPDSFELDVLLHHCGEHFVCAPESFFQGGDCLFEGGVVGLRRSGGFSGRAILDELFVAAVAERRLKLKVVPIFKTTN
jgi:hypothetical protein